MKNLAVIGAGFGDCAKGVVTDYLCSQYPDAIVTRFSGGHQAGHTVVHNGIRHVFSNFGSGSFRGNITYWSRLCTVDPVGITNELKVLRKKGIEPTLYLDPRCPITTPYDKWTNTQNSWNRKNGTCGVGFGKTIEREEQHYSLLVGDLLYPKIFETKLELIRKKYLQEFAEYDKDFLPTCYLLLEEKQIRIELMKWDRDINRVESVNIFEGSQGLMLDQDIGFFPHVTRGNCGMTNLKKLEVTDPEIYLVTRCYQTRHGNGPMTNEDLKEHIIHDPNETNVTHKYQGEFRVSMLDADLLRYAIQKDDIKDFTLVITCFEHVTSYVYTSAGNKYVYPDAEIFAKCLSKELGAKNFLCFKNHKVIEFK
ncbi:MAG TPA: adenylosuccinate synthetase [Patescibacteria group bacterium]|nr:adenylosuccinate synthetase [Patescibacteria group bacterium]